MMTQQDTLMPGPALDALVAEQVMGWQYKIDGDLCWIAPTNFPDWELWCPSTSIAAAWEVVEKCDLFADHDLALTKLGESWAVIGHCVGGMEYYGTVASAPTAPHAICLAALKVLGGRP